MENKVVPIDPDRRLALTTEEENKIAGYKSQIDISNRSALIQYGAASVDMDTLHKINTDLFSTIDEVLSIQEDGRRKRGEAEKELLNVESELRKKSVHHTRL